MAHDRQAQRARQHHPDLPAFPRPELNPVENVWQYLRQNWLSNTVFENYDAIIDAACAAWRSSSPNPKGSRPSECGRLGSRRSAAMTLGITCHCRGRAGAAATRTRFSRRLRLSAFKCWLSERSVPSELESFEAICPASGASSYLEAYFALGRCLLSKVVSCIELDAVARTRSSGILGCCRNTVLAALHRPYEPVRWRGEETGSPRRAYRHALAHCWGTT